MKHVKKGNKLKIPFKVKGLNIVSIRSDHGDAFQNESFEKFYEENGIHHNFSAPWTLQQNGVMERKNRSLKEGARTFLNETKLPKYFWADIVHTKENPIWNL